MTALRRWLAAPTLEIIPVEGVVGTVARHLEPGSRVSVVHLRRRGLDATVSVTCDLAAAGHRAIPHLGASNIRSTSELSRQLQTLRGAGVSELMVLGGDGAEPQGPFAGAADLIEAIAQQWRPLPRIGVAGYPEGHPSISTEQLCQALVRKQALGAAYVVTQMCFDPAALTRWIAALESTGVRLRVVLGVPGVVRRRRLLSVATKVGVGSSLAALRKQRGFGTRLLRSSTFTPDELLDQLASSETGVAGRVDGLHVFTFNAVRETLAWARGRANAAAPR